MKRITYELLGATYLSTYLLVDGEKRHIVFQGGGLGNGIFISTEPAEIKAMNESKSLNATYRIKMEENLPDEETHEKVKAPAPPKATIDPTGKTAVPGITSGQKAKAYLLENFPEDIKLSDLKNNQAIKEVAAGKNLYFPELP